jgi:hypothetical protein
MLTVVMPSGDMLSVIMLSVILLGVVTPWAMVLMCMSASNLSLFVRIILEKVNYDCYWLDGASTPSIMNVRMTTFSITTLRIIDLNLTLSIMGLIVTLSIIRKHLPLRVIMLNIVMLSIVMLNVVMQCIIKLSIVI